MEFRLARALDAALRAAAATVPALGPEFDPEVRVADPRHADFQANGALPWAKKRGLNPRQMAQELAVAFAATAGAFAEHVDCTVAGPGFLNFKLKPAALAAWLDAHRTVEDLRRGAGGLRAGRKVVVDFSSPNNAKQMHVGHIRSTVLGEAVARLLAFAGAEVVRDNHIGDWGTPYGMLILAIRESGYDLDAEDPEALVSLDRLYKRGSEMTKQDPAKLEEARAIIAQLQAGEPTLRRMWQRISEISYQAFQQIYDRLGVRFDVVLGESFYEDKVERVWAELRAVGLAEESDGALLVFHDEHPRYSRQAERPNPFIIRKADGASNYAATDLATILYRHEHFRADEALYLVDKRQSDHFEQLFLTARKWFDRRGWKLPELRHVAFGSINGPDGKPIKTRSGESIKLRELLDEAVERVLAIITEKNPEAPEAERRAMAERIGPQAVMYADLMQNRTSDYVFAWDKMLALDGHSAVYLLYAEARLHSVFRKAGCRPGENEELASAFATPTELALARKLLGFPAALESALADYRPHLLCLYLYELAGEFSAFYAADPILNAEEPDVRARRLKLCARTLLVLDTGLRLVGLTPLERM